MSLRLSLTAKCLLLVSIPMLFEAGLVWALLNLQHETEAEAQQATEAHEVSQRLANISSELFALWDAVDANRKGLPNYQRAFAMFSTYGSTFQPLLEKLAQDYSLLHKQVKDKPEFSELVQQSEESLLEIQTIVKGGAADLNSGHFDLVASRYEPGARRVSDLFVRLGKQQLAIAAKSEHVYAELSSKRHSASRTFMANFVLVTCFANAFFCIALVLFLVKGVVSRLSVMRDNASLLAANKPLREPLQGLDEIAELDRVFHKMAATLEETDRAKQELVSMLTHDLRTPLTAIQGSLELLDGEIKKDNVEREHRLVEVALRNSDRMMRLINDLLDIKKIQSGMMAVKPGKVCVAEVFEEVALSLTGWVEDNALELKCDDTDLFVYAEREKVERIIFNLVANAIKFSLRGSSIYLFAESLSDKIQISVADEGRGIPQNRLDSLFERFQQVEINDKATAGSGLGLAICQQLVNLQGGIISVRSEIGKGSCFSFTLPKA